MKISPRNTITAALLAVSAFAAAQQDNMTVTLKDGTHHTFTLSDIDSLTFENAKQAEALALTIPMVSEVAAQWQVEPADETATYNVMYLEKSEFDKYKSDDDVVADDLKYYQELADGYGMTLADVLASFLYSGQWSDYLADGLLPGTDYVVWAYGMDGNGKRTTPFYKQVVSTLHVSSPTDKKVAVKLEKQGASLVATFTPDNPDMPYTAGYINADDLALGETVEQNMQKNISRALYDYLANGAPISDYLADSAQKGTQTVTYNGLSAAGQTYIVAAFLNQNAAICSPVAKADATAALAAPSSVPAAKIKKMPAVVRHTAKKVVLKKQ